MLDELNTIKFEKNLAKEADLTPVYQLTKVANDSFHLYSFENRSGAAYNTKGVLKAIASLRGGSYMSADLTKKMAALDNYGSITITADALSLSKKAALSTDEEPWKLVSVNGVEYFVKAEADTEDKEEVSKEASLSGLTKTASAKTQTYTIRINAHNLSEIAKIANSAEEAMGANPGSFETNPDTNAIVFTVDSAEPGYKVQDGIHKALEHGKIFLPQDNVVVADEAGCLCGHNHGCPCCGGNPHQEGEYHRDHTGMHSACLPGTTIMLYADDPKTLKEYADAHATDVTVAASEQTGGYPMDGQGDANTAFEHDNKEGLAKDTFASLLDSFLHTCASDGFDKAASDAGLVYEKNTGAIKNPEDPAAQEEMKSNPDNYEVVNKQAAPEVPNAPQEPAPSNPADQPVKMEEKPAGQGNRVVDPNEKPIDDTKQTGDDSVKRWKGMREDPKTGKYVVYITENEQHIYDNVNDALNFMVRK